ncbi:hypothetical protein [Vibrio phage XM1]|nr:hypothetical protein [Vibrio phage XM1]
MAVRNLKGYTAAQREMAYEIRGHALSKLDAQSDENEVLKNKLMKITSPMFFIKYREALESGKIALSLSKYEDENYYRRNRYATKAYK